MKLKLPEVPPPVELFPVLVIFVYLVVVWVFERWPA